MRLSAHTKGNMTTPPGSSNRAHDHGSTGQRFHGETIYA